MYVDNVAKLALGLEGNTDPTQAELEAAVTATGYTGYVSMEYDLQKTPPAPDTTSGGSGADTVKATKSSKKAK